MGSSAEKERGLRSNMTINYLTRLKSNLQKTHLFFQTRTLTSTKPTLFPNGNPNQTSLLREETLMSLFKKCSTLNDLKQLHAQVIQSGFENNLFIIGKLVLFCAVSDHGDMNYAVSVFENIQNPDGFLWNAMIRGFGKNSNEPQKAFEYYKRMQEKGLEADNFTFSFLGKICGQLGSVLLGKQMHCRVLKHGLHSHMFVRNTLVHIYGLFRDIGACRQLFDEIPSPDLVAWNVIIDCNVYCGKWKEALELFFQMLKIGVEPDAVTVVVTLSACSALGALDFGRWIHSCIINTALESILEINNALIDMYAKCGALEEAYETFNKMNKKNTVTWNAMILGLATHGHTKEALALFSRMLERQPMAPDEITFLGVLLATSHGGMVGEGRKFFEVMRSEYKIQPTIKHYGCMVDLLGRAGFLEEAYHLIKGMPMKCNAIVWRTLLGACRLHGNLELGEQVREHLLELEPDHSSDYVLLANMYASAGRWNEVSTVRKTMQIQGVHKPEPGNSSIGVHPTNMIGV